MNANSAVHASAIKHFRSPKTVIARFIARRTMRGAAFWALAFGAIVASKAAGYVAVYPTVQARAKLAASFGNNIGFDALFGTPHHLETVAGYTLWNAMAGPVIIGAIWAFLLATKTMRGEESAGRWELLLSGQTTARRAAVSALTGLGAAIAVLYALTAVVFVGVGKIHKVDFGVSAALFFALATTCSALLFMTVGALTSQLMPTRSRAAGLAAGIFGACFLLRAVADTTSIHWLLDITPLGWIEKLQPLYGSQPLWLIPIFSLTAIAAAAAIFLAGRRDLGDSIFADNDTAKPRLALLGTPLSVAFRLTRAVSLAWLVVIGFVAVFFGFLTKAATSAFSGSASLEHKLSRVVHSSQTYGAKTFLGVIFFIIMPLLMSYAASAAARMREDEAEGYIDNFLVRAVSRLQWLWGRIALTTVVIVVASLISGTGAWVGAAAQHSGVTFGSLLLAGLNIMAPALLILGIGIAVMGILPRATNFAVYGVIAWSFLIDILGSGLNLNHWLLDTSILHHVTLAPAASPNWQAAAVLATLGLALCITGAAAFNNRDLQAE